MLYRNRNTGSEIESDSILGGAWEALEPSEAPEDIPQEEVQEEEVVEEDDLDLSEYNVDDLKGLAADYDISLEGITKKADIIQAIKESGKI